MYSNAEGRGEELRQQGFAEEGLLSGNQNDIVPLPDEDEEDAPAPALAGQLDAEQQGHNFHHHHHQQQQQQQQEGGLDWGEGLGGEDDLANYEEGLGDYEEVEAVLPRQEDPAVAAAAAQHLGEQQWLRQSAALAGKVSAGVQVAYSVMKPEITQEELARAEVRLFQDIAAAMLEEGLAEAAAAAGYTIEQLDLYVVAQLIKREQEGTAYTTVAQAEYLSRMILLSHRLVYEDPGSRGKLQRVMVAAEAEEAAMRLRAANMPEPPGGWPVYRLQSGSILMLTVAEPNSSRFQLVPLDPPVQLQLQLIEPLGSGGLGSVWGAKPLQQEAWRGPLNLAANDTVPEVVAIKMGVLPCTPHGSAACDGSTTWRLTRENLKAVGFDAFKEAACMKATGPIPFTGDLLVAGVAQVQLGALPSSIVYDMPALVMPCAALGSLHRVVHADQLRVGRLFPDKRMPEPMVRHGVTQVLVALAAGNLVGDIIHRDLKPGNILMRVINGVPVWVLIDYGLAARLNELALGRPKRTYAGTEAYMAPEQRSGEKDQTSKTDMYTVGLIMLELLWGKVVMDQMDRRPEPGPRAQVLHRLLSTDNSIPGISGSLRDFLWFACHPEPDMRFTPDQALQHHYMRGL
jgi:serine/threonine protein kinase